MIYDLVEVATEGDWRAYHTLRRSILWEARGRDDYDPLRPEERAAENHPLLLKFDGRAIGTTRLDELGEGKGVVRLVTIAADLQRQGHGRVLSRLVETYARGKGISKMFVNAAPDAVGYYEKTGWRFHTWNADELKGFTADCRQMMKVIGQPS